MPFWWIIVLIFSVLWFCSTLKPLILYIIISQFCAQFEIWFNIWKYLFLSCASSQCTITKNLVSLASLHQEVSLPNYEKNSKNIQNVSFTSVPECLVLIKVEIRLCRMYYVQRMTLKCNVLSKNSIYCMLHFCVMLEVAREQSMK